jgi:hypothetical protein
MSASGEQSDTQATDPPTSRPADSQYRQIRQHRSRADHLTSRREWPPTRNRLSPRGLRQPQDLLPLKFTLIGAEHFRVDVHDQLPAILVALPFRESLHINTCAIRFHNEHLAQIPLREWR